MCSSSSPATATTITYTDKSSLSFWQSGSSAVLTQESDRNGNAVTYTWGANTITITAANGQAITVNLSGGKATSATYATSAGTREVDYSTSAPWQVTSYTGQAPQHVITYGYDATPRLTQITANDWPTTGQNATEQLIYSSGALTEVQYPGYNATSNPDAHETISYGTGTATLSRYGRVNDLASTAVTETENWNTLNETTQDNVSG